MSFAELERRAQAVATKLLAKLQPGDRALLLYPTGLDFIAAFLGCLQAGIIAVPAYPLRKGRSTERLRAIVQDATPAIALTDASSVNSLHGDVDLGRVPLLTLDQIASDESGMRVELDISRETPAFLQYTSGSTGTPKGVVISHGNILSNLEQIVACNALDETAVCVSWLPLFHDMGLLGTMLTPIFLGSTTVLMEPGAFMQKPLRWLQAMTKYRGTVSAAPDSAYALCMRTVTEQDKSTLDLSSWHTALNGAEPVQPSTMENFTRAFAGCGFRAEALRPVYGMAETTLFIAGQRAGMRPVVQSFDTHELAQGIVAEHSGAQALASCGAAWGEHRLRIVRPESDEPCAANEIGEIWFAGPSVGQGYWNRPEESESTFRACIRGEQTPYLRTGDLGFLHKGHLFVTGRLKDLIIIGGRNLYPQDLERTAEACDSDLAVNGSAAFSIEVNGEERIVLACEVRRAAVRRFDADALAAKIRRSLSEHHEASLSHVVFLKPASLPRTSSGKVQRRKTREAYLQVDGLPVVAEWKKPEPLLSEQDDRDDLLSWLSNRVAARAGIAAEGLNPHEPFSSYGLNSADAISLSGELEERLERRLPPTLVYDYPTVALLASHLQGQQANVSHKLNAPSDEPIAIIGMGCRLPGANDPETFWRLLRDGHDAVAAARRQVDGLPPSALLAEVDRFDAEFFGINAREAEAMDPQQRLLLEVAWETVENAGIAPQNLAGTRTAVIVGVSNCDYMRLTESDSPETGPYASTGNALSIVANRISFALDLRGPSWSIDTACSSSLVALHQACNSLRHGECDAALTGGANLILTSRLSSAFTQAGMLSPTGECRAFDADANGYVRGEGIGLVLLKRLSDAVRDGDRIEAIVRGTAVNQDGRSNGLTAPNGPAQQAVIEAALRAAAVERREISLIEAHGTGTPLGDPIELNALTDVLGQGRSPDETCWIGSVKTNIGHLEAAAGIAGVIKTVLALKNCEIAPNLHFRAINSYIAIADKPFHIAEHAIPWPAEGRRRLAGVSSFGFGGTNAHAVLEEAPEPSAIGGESSVNILAFSARTAKALRALHEAYADFLTTRPDLPLEDFAFTVNRSRSLFAERAALVFADRNNLIEQLRGTAATPTGFENLEEIAVRYRRGETIDWTELQRGRPISLPTYPFERRRYWNEKREKRHALLGYRLAQQAHLPTVWTWESEIDTPLLKKHGIDSPGSLPYSTYVEMALTASSEIDSGQEDDGMPAVNELAVVAPLLPRDGKSTRVQTVLSRETAYSFRFAVYRHTDDAEWQLCAQAEVTRGVSEPAGDGQ